MATLSLNQEKKDAKIDRILQILKSFLSCFKTNYPSKTEHLANPKILPFLVQDKQSFKDKTSCKTLNPSFPAADTILDQAQNKRAALDGQLP